MNNFYLTDLLTKLPWGSEEEIQQADILTTDTLWPHYFTPRIPKGKGYKRYGIYK